MLTVKWGLENLLMHRVVVRIEKANIYKDLGGVSIKGVDK